VTIPEPVLRTAIERLEAHAAHPDTGALHDPIYGLLNGQGPEAEAALAAALQAHSGHPMVADLRALFAEHITVPSPDLAFVLSRYEPVAEDMDLVAEVDRRLSEGATRDRVLRAQIANLGGHVETLGRTANGLAALSAIVAVFGAIGWLIALDWLEITWLDPAVPRDPAAAASGHGQVPLDERSIR